MGSPFWGFPVLQNTHHQCLQNGDPLNSKNGDSELNPLKHQSIDCMGSPFWGFPVLQTPTTSVCKTGTLKFEKKNKTKQNKKTKTGTLKNIKQQILWCPRFWGPRFINTHHQCL